MTLARKNGSAKAGQPTNAGTSQPVPLKAGDNLFDQRFSVESAAVGYLVWRGFRRPGEPQLFATLDDLMTFLADQAIEKIGRVEQ